MDSKYVVRTFQSIDLNKTRFINDLRQNPRKNPGKTQVVKTQKPITQKPGFLGSGFLGSANPDFHLADMRSRSRGVIFKI